MKGARSAADRNEDGTSNSSDDDDQMKGGRSTSLSNMDEDGNESGTSSADEVSAPSKRVPRPRAASAVQTQQTSKKRRRRPSAPNPYLFDSDNDDLPTNKLVQGGKSSSDPIDVDLYASLWEPSSSRHYVCHFFCFHSCFDLT